MLEIFNLEASGEDRFHLVKKYLVDSWDWLEEEFGDYAKSSLVKSVQDLLSGLAKFLLFNRDPVDLFETLWESCSELVLEICCHVKEGVLEKSLERAWERGEECCPGEWTKLREFPVFSRCWNIFPENWLAAIFSHFKQNLNSFLLGQFITSSDDEDPDDIGEDESFCAWETLIIGSMVAATAEVTVKYLGNHLRLPSWNDIDGDFKDAIDDATEDLPEHAQLALEDVLRGDLNVDKIWNTSWEITERILKALSLSKFGQWISDYGGYFSTTFARVSNVLGESLSSILAESIFNEKGSDLIFNVLHSIFTTGEISVPEILDMVTDFGWESLDSIYETCVESGLEWLQSSLRRKEGNTDQD